MSQTARPDLIRRGIAGGWRMRTGRSLGRTLYLHDPDGGGPDEDICVGMMDSPEIAGLVALLWNMNGEEDAAVP